jgi:putative acetyltransferase
LYVFEEDRQIIATISLEQGRWQFRHVLFIDGIAVKESCQGRGIGHKILEEVEALANQTGVIKRLELLVEEDNPRAIELYTQMGFHEEGRKVGFIKRPEQKHYVDEIVMGKIIG